MYKCTYISLDVSVRSLHFSSDYHHLKGRNSTIGTELEPVINVCCEVMVNLRSQLQEGTACQETHFGDVILKIQITLI